MSRSNAILVLRKFLEFLPEDSFEAGFESRFFRDTLRKSRALLLCQLAKLLEIGNEYFF